MTSELRDSTVFIFYIYQLSVHFQFLPNMAGFPVILNYFRHNGVFGKGKTPNSRAQRHCDKCFTSYKRISKQKALLRSPKRACKRASEWKTEVRRFDRVWSGSNCLPRLSADNTSRHSQFLLSAGSTHPNITEKLLTRFNLLPHIFPHCEITSMQRVFHFVLAWPRLWVQGKLLLLDTHFLCIISLLCSNSEPGKVWRADPRNSWDL